ncbi:uncharacterized protein V1518DRAFT_414479 [Limtongia smithiae]|uniref:uncharacterized protein n=1 Tax=Limtongia smithiae TaxID=1125753 RepID=UPI0034CEF123
MSRTHPARAPPTSRVLEPAVIDLASSSSPPPSSSAPSSATTAITQDTTVQDATVQDAQPPQDTPFWPDLLRHPAPLSKPTTTDLPPSLPPDAGEDPLLAARKLAHAALVSRREFERAVVRLSNCEARFTALLSRAATATTASAAAIDTQLEELRRDVSAKLAELHDAAKEVHTTAAVLPTIAQLVSTSVASLSTTMLELSRDVAEMKADMKAMLNPPPRSGTARPPVSPTTKRAAPPTAARSKRSKSDMLMLPPPTPLSDSMPPPPLPTDATPP